MNRPQQIRSVFSELRTALGSQLSSLELLDAAGALVELFEEDTNEPNFDLRVGGLPFARWALDRAFADGGWRVLALESHGDTSTNEDEVDSIDVKRLFSTLESEVYA